MDDLSPTQVALDDPFWSSRVQVNAAHAIFHQRAQLEASGCIANFRIAAGEQEGWREGWFFADSDAYKWLDAASRIVAGQPNARLAALMDDLIALVSRAQAADGYIFTYNQIHFPGTRWMNLQIEHELYCHGHLIEAGVSHYEATGRTELLAIARRVADLLVRDFGGRGPERTPGHEEVEIALLRLHRVTGHAAYLDLARHFLEQRGRTPRFALRCRSNAAGPNVLSRCATDGLPTWLPIRTTPHTQFRPTTRPKSRVAPICAGWRAHCRASTFSSTRRSAGRPCRWVMPCASAISRPRSPCSIASRATPACSRR